MFLFLFSLFCFTYSVSDVILCPMPETSRMSHGSFTHARCMMNPLRSPSRRLFILPSPFRRWIPAVLGQISLYADSEDDLHAARIGGLHDVSRRNHSGSPLLGQRDSRQRLGSSKGTQGSRRARSNSKLELELCGFSLSSETIELRPR